MLLTASELPSGWCPTRLGDVILKPRPKIPSDPNSQLPFIGMDHIEPHTFHLIGQDAFSKMKSAGSYFQPGDVLYGRLRPYLNKVHTAKFEGVASAEFIVLPASENHDSNFLRYKLHQRRFIEFAMSRSSGDRPRVKFDGIADFEFGLPPLKEQQRIVEKIDTLFARLDKGEEAVREVQKLLTRYRQSVLKSAVTGKLVESDRSGWDSLELGSLLEDIRYGTAKKCSYEEANTAVLRIPNVVGGSVSLDDLKYTDLTEKERNKLALEEGDVLIVRSNGSANLVARGAVVSGDAIGMAFAGYLIRLRVDQGRILPDYLHLSLNSPQTRQIIERQARSTSGVHNINSGEVKAIAIELPPIAEQRKIIAAVDDAFQKIVDLERWCETELKRSASLRQSILKDAFAGRLVPQDPNDEPASALLARIAADKPTAKKTRRKTPA